VTGASRGIGRATASALAKAGAHVVVHYGHSAQEAESLVAEIRTKGGHADTFLANYLCLIAQFLNATTNLRKDEYGGGLENRSRLLFEVLDAVLNEVDAKRVGVKISPMHEGGAFAANNETLPITEYVIRKLNTYNLSHLLLMGITTDFSGTPLEMLAEDGMFRHFRPLYEGTLIANVNMDRERGNRLITEELADLIAFGRPYIANPDLVRRFTEDAPLAEVDWETIYASEPRGYSDYTTFNHRMQQGADYAKDNT